MTEAVKTQRIHYIYMVWFQAQQQLSEGIPPSHLSFPMSSCSSNCKLSGLLCAGVPEGRLRSLKGCPILRQLRGQVPEQRQRFL